MMNYRIICFVALFAATYAQFPQLSRSYSFEATATIIVTKNTLSTTIYTQYNVASDSTRLLVLEDTLTERGSSRTTIVSLNDEASYNIGIFGHCNMHPITGNPNRPFRNPANPWAIFNQAVENPLGTFTYIDGNVTLVLRIIDGLPAMYIETTKLNTTGNETSELSIMINRFNNQKPRFSTFTIPETCSNFICKACFDQNMTRTTTGTLRTSIVQQEQQLVLLVQVIAQQEQQLVLLAQVIAQQEQQLLTAQGTLNSNSTTRTTTGTPSTSNSTTRTTTGTPRTNSTTRTTTGTPTTSNSTTRTTTGTPSTSNSTTRTTTGTPSTSNSTTRTTTGTPRTNSTTRTTTGTPSTSNSTTRTTTGTPRTNSTTRTTTGTPTQVIAQQEQQLVLLEQIAQQEQQLVLLEQIAQQEQQLVLLAQLLIP
ncbi:hypothetical protein LOD99_8363 [Oopsacas minuta]|uniref:Uncharacterized protein n=1 Tax=Oopsacas minuta TaxID=111878 RepID=A0AAV7JGJ8_9METZ|nr:hypothetical protein LOD99_8363 [Oopsacas minuta]